MHIKRGTWCFGWVSISIRGIVAGGLSTSNGSSARTSAIRKLEHMDWCSNPIEPPANTTQSLCELSTTILGSEEPLLALVDCCEVVCVARIGVSSMTCRKQQRSKTQSTRACYKQAEHQQSCNSIALGSNYFYPSYCCVSKHARAAIKSTAIFPCPQQFHKCTQTYNQHAHHIERTRDETLYRHD